MEEMTRDEIMADFKKFKEYLEENGVNVEVMILGYGSGSVIGYGSKETIEEILLRTFADSIGLKLVNK